MPVPLHFVLADVAVAHADAGDLVVGHGHREQKKDVDVEGQKDQGVEVIDGAITDPGIANRRHAAFDQLVGLLGDVTGTAGGEEGGDDERADGKAQAAEKKCCNVEQVYGRSLIQNASPTKFAERRAFTDTYAAN